MSARAASISLFFSVFLVAPIGVRADVAPLLEPDEVRALVAEHTAGDFPTEDAVVLFTGERVRLEPDGSIARRTQRIILLRTERAIGALGDPRLTFNRRDQELLIHRCRTYVPGGAEIDATDHAFNPVTPDAVSRCPDRMFYQDMVITHVGIERGCVIELDTEVRDLVPHQAWLEGEVFLHERYPVLDWFLEIETPSHITLHQELVPWQGGPEHHQDQGRDYHVWRFGSLPGIRETDDGCGGRLARGRLLYSTCPSWEYLVRRTREQIESAAQPDTLSAGFVNSAELEGAGQAEKVAKILSALSSQTQRADVRPFSGLPNPRSGAETFVFRCGDPWDRAGLAIAMLKRVDLQAALTLRANASDVQESVPMIGQFSEVWLRAQVDGETLLLDPVAGRLESPVSLTRPFLILSEQGPEWRDEPAGQGLSRMWIDLVMEPDGGVAGRVDLRLEGVQWHRSEYDAPGELADEVAARLLPEGVRGEVDVRWFGPDRCDLRFEVEAPSLGERDGSCTYLRLPAPPAGIEEALGGYDLDRTERSSPLFLPAPMEEIVRWRLRLPEGIEPVYLPAAVNEESRAARFAMTVQQSARPADEWSRPDERKVRGEEIRIGWTASLPMAGIPAARYGELKRVIGRYRAENQRLIILGGWPADE